MEHLRDALGDYISVWAYYNADTPELAREYFSMGIDTVLTNDYLAIYNAVKDDYLKVNY